MASSLFSMHVVLRNKIKVGRGFVPVIATTGQTFGSEGLSEQSLRHGRKRIGRNQDDVLEWRTVPAFVRERPAQTIPLLSQIMSGERTSSGNPKLAALNVDQRLMSTLTHLSGDRSFTTDDGRLKLENSHHRLLCEMVGATRESIALALSRLVSAGIAERKGMTFLIEPASLTSTFGENGNGDSAIPIAREISR
jgi:hypothetical protein